MKTNYVKRLLFGVVVTCICLPLNAMSGSSYGGKGLVFERYTPPGSYNKTVNVGQTHSKKRYHVILADVLKMLEIGPILILKIFLNRIKHWFIIFVHIAQT